MFELAPVFKQVPPPQVQNNFAQLLANVHDTTDMTVPKT